MKLIIEFKNPSEHETELVHEWLGRFLEAHVVETRCYMENEDEKIVKGWGND